MDIYRVEEMVVGVAIEEVEVGLVLGCSVNVVEWSGVEWSGVDWGVFDFFDELKER